jgi:hypothetical protein
MKIILKIKILSIIKKLKAKILAKIKYIISFMKKIRIEKKG